MFFIKWLFKDKPNTMVISLKSIIYNKLPILYATHDDDGMWQFLDGSIVSEDNAVVVGLKEIVEIDNTINLICDLPLGWIAWRDSVGDEWARSVK